MSSLLKVDAHLDLNSQEEDIKSVAATMYAGMLFSNQTVRQLVLLTYFQPGLIQWVEKTLWVSKFHGFTA